MKKESEKQVDKFLVAEVKKRKGRAVKFHTQFLSGFPDRVVLLPGGYIFFAEMKGTGGTPDPLQKVWLKILTKLGFKAVCINSKKQVSEHLKIYDGQYN